MTIDWTTPVYAVGTFAAGMGTVYAAVVRPRRQAHEARETERQRLADEDEHRRAGRYAFLDGVPAVPGMSDAIEPAAVRMRGVEVAVRDMSRSVDTVARRMDEANGTNRRIEGKVDALSEQLAAASTANLKATQELGGRT